MRVAMFASAVALCSMVLSVGSAEAVPAFKCHKKVKLKKAMIGKRGQYEVKKGLSVKKRSGWLDRKKFKVTKKCFLGGLKSDDCIVMHFTKKAFEKAGRARVQCVLSADASKTLKGRGKGALGYSMDFIDGYEVILYGKNKTGYKSNTGSNSDRNKQLKKQLAKKNLIMKSFCVPRAMTKFAKAIGKKVYCQWYHEKSDSVFFATEYTFEGPKK